MPILGKGHFETGMFEVSKDILGMDSMLLKDRHKFGVRPWTGQAGMGVVMMYPIG